MKQKQLIKVFVGMALIIGGNVLLMACIIIAIIASSGAWLVAALVCLLAALIGMLLIISELSRAVKIVKKYTPAKIRRRIKYIKHD